MSEKPGTGDLARRGFYQYGDLLDCRLVSDVEEAREGAADACPEIRVSDHGSRSCAARRLGCSQFGTLPNGMYDLS